jgi:hypothetical protein
LFRQLPSSSCPFAYGGLAKEMQTQPPNPGRPSSPPPLAVPLSRSTPGLGGSSVHGRWASRFKANDDYPSYLKRQSYDDLIAISCNLNKNGHPDLYAMVLAEIAERDKRGEKPQ